MADEISECFDTGSVRLTDDVIFYLSQNHLKGKDALYLALSGASEQFSSIYGENRRVIDMSKCYFVSPDNWQRFFQKHLTPTSVTVFNSSDCYWLSADLLSSSVIQMTSLQELIVEGSPISLSHFPAIFKACDKLVKLSFSLLERNVDKYLSENVLMGQGFGRLTHLKIFTKALNEQGGLFWRAILGILKWCRDCINLLLEIPCCTIADLGSGSGDELGLLLNQVDMSPTLNSLRNDYFPFLGWMRSLESLAVLTTLNLKRSGAIYPKDWLIVMNLLRFLFNNNDGYMMNSLQRFWTEENQMAVGFGKFLELNGTPVKSLLVLDNWNNFEIELLNQERFRQLEQLGGFWFQRLDYLPNLKYARGRLRDSEGLNQFCESHPLLEYLLVDDELTSVDDAELFEGLDRRLNFIGNWTLPFLKVLVYGSDIPNPGGVARLMEFCPKIQELHVGSSWQKDRTIGFFSTCRFKQLSFLTIKEMYILEEFSLLTTVIRQCPKLDRLHLGGSFYLHSLFSQPVDQLKPITTNLKDFRLQSGQSGFNPTGVTALLKGLQKSSKLLERLVLYNESKPCQLEEKFEEFIVQFVKETHLVVLCLIGFKMDTSVAEGIERRLFQEFLPERPSLWVYLGLEVPKAIDLPVPMRVHLDEIVDPVDWRYTPPRF